MTSQQCYAGQTPDGKMILTPWFAGVLRRDGLLTDTVPVAPRGFAMDSAPAEDSLDDDLDDYEDLNRAYERMLRSDGQPSINPTLTSDDFEGRAESTRGKAAVVNAGFSAGDPTAEDAALQKFKKARGWDSVDPVMEKEWRRNFQLEQAYAAVRDQAQPLPPLESRRDANGGLSYV
jgi:3-methyladenine DNA glycosylase/8-oxoguanine DNA glycosylase